MATRYWVGGTGTWNTSNTGNWSATSGGASGASAPTASDDVVFDGNSGTGTTTVSGTVNVLSLNTTGFTGTITGTGTVTFNGGNFTIGSGTTWTSSSSGPRLSFVGSSTITPNGKSVYQVTINGSGITVQLAGALTTVNSFTLTQGTFTTNDFNVTIGTSFSSSGSVARTMNCGASVITVAADNTAPATLTAWDTSTTTNLTFNAGTSEIKIKNSITNSMAITITFGGITLNKITVDAWRDAVVLFSTAFTCNSDFKVTYSTTMTARISFQSAVTFNINKIVMTQPANTVGSNGVFFAHNVTGGAVTTISLTNDSVVWNCAFAGLLFNGSGRLTAHYSARMYNTSGNIEFSYPHPNYRLGL